METNKAVAPVAANDSKPQPAPALPPSRSRRARRFAILLGLLFTAGWLALSEWYIETYIGWSSLAAMLPHELGATLSGVATPVLVVWILIAFVERGMELRGTARALRAQLAELAYPVDAAEAKATTIALS